ncbi:MAG: carboxypeptidase regulatory-like domain-containing protein [Candidatus Eisenbacteria bacterium]|nr:carboxypeptidase regulatory-like domain-containing protein [Candidatus Eisenbacteria bacterium]
MTRATLLSATRLLLLLALGLSACSEKTVVVSGPGGVGGVLSGVVADDLGPVQATIRVESAERIFGIDSSWPASLLTTTTRPDGSYAIDVPPGEWRVGIDAFGLPGQQGYDYAADVYWRVSALAPNWRLADTLSVAPGSAREHLDFRFGTISARVSVPTEWLDGRISLLAIQDGNDDDPFDRFAGGAGAEVSGPVVDLSAPHLPAGTYRLELWCQFYDFDEDMYRAESFWLPRGVTSSQAEPVTVIAGARVDVQHGVSLEPMIVSGTALGAWQSIRNDPPRVFLVTPDSSVARAFDADATGSFQSYFSMRSNLKVAWSGAYSSHRSGVNWVGGPTFERAEIFHPGPSGNIEAIQIVDSGLAIRFVLPEGVSIGSPDVSLYDQDGSYILSRRYDPGADAVEISGLAIKPYSIVVRQGFTRTAEWISQWYDRASRQEDATLVTPGVLGGLSELQVNLERGGTISGVVSDGADPPPRDYSVVLTTDQNEGVAALVRGAADDGSFSVLGISPGTYRLGAVRGQASLTHRGTTVGAYWYPGVDNWENAQSITIVGTETLEHLDITLPPP